MHITLKPGERLTVSTPDGEPVRLVNMDDEYHQGLMIDTGMMVELKANEPERTGWQEEFAMFGCGIYLHDLSAPRSVIQRLADAGKIIIKEE